MVKRGGGNKMKKMLVEEKDGIDIANLPANCPVRFWKGKNLADQVPMKQIFEKIRSANVGSRREIKR